ncbi:MAG: lysine 2,3-aminomutase, partial [Bradyrhizobium sp.]
MNRIERPTTLRSAADLVAQGLAAPSDEATLERVAQRYAVAVTTHLADLI